MSSENWKGRSSITNMLYSGKTSLLPPKSPFQSIPPSYVDYVPNPSVGKKPVGNPREGNTHHQRTSSESFLLEEQPSWLDELLNEPDTPVRKGGHHRSSSDSFAYIDTPDVNLDYLANDENNKSRNMVSPSWQLPDLGHYRDIRHGSYYTDTKSSGKNQTRSWDRSSNAAAYPHSLPSPREKSLLQSSKSSAKPQGAEAIPSTASEKREAVMIFSREPNGFSERKQPSSAKPSVSETDTKRANQQFAQRSRVRKLQYIAELERNVQTLQSEGSDVSAELDFLNQRVLILNMENKALKQRLESLSQERLIKHLEHEVLEREKGRLRALYQQQQQPQPQQRQQSSGLRRTSSRDLDQQLANLSLKHKEASAGPDPISGQPNMST
ncbi:basic leucine zipper transcription factor [Lithospermum erythrorhizon]|uniref:Basic leucine zipper transcription factor n=1 Tax=Lithospermum erythrorhizon TaxID=34254 RepID=A0AAV3R6Z8_LITER